MLQSLERSRPPHVDEDELSIFADVLAHEVHLYEPRGYISGTGSFSFHSHRRRVRAADLITISTWFVEDLKDVSTEAAFILLVEHLEAFRSIVALRPWRLRPMLIATGCGLPRFALRRALSFLSERLEIPVFTLTDNDTWGYFLYSLMVRGLLYPRGECARTSVRNLNYLGLSSAQVASNRDWHTRPRPWRPQWDLRIAELKQYPCFAGPKWQAELQAFASQQYAVDLEAVMGRTRATTFYRRVVLEAIDNETYLEALS